MIDHIHQRVLEEDGFLFLHQICFRVTEDNLIDIRKISLHAVDGSNIIGPDLVCLNENIPYLERLVSLNILVEDGVIENKN